MTLQRQGLSPSEDLSEAESHSNLGPNAPLLGRSDAFALLATPALVLDLDVMNRNMRTMAEFGRASGLALRPHAKTHKSLEIGSMQVELGAVGLCCAKLGEAEALAHPAIGSLLITSPIAGPLAFKRLRTLLERFPALAVVTDSEANLADLAAATRGLALDVFVDVDPGQHRTGVATAEAAGALARRIQESGDLRFAGVQFFSGPSQHIVTLREREEDVQRRSALLREVVIALQAAGMPPRVVTGGGTGTFDLDARVGLMTELQVGSYIFMDDQYLRCDFGSSGEPPFKTALSVASRVISANWPRMATVDAGLKAFAGAPDPPTIISGAPPMATYAYRGDEHGAIIVPRGQEAPHLGDIVMLRTPHCDPTVNLYDHFHVVRGSTLVDIWPITARGRSA